MFRAWLQCEKLFCCKKILFLQKEIWRETCLFLKYRTNLKKVRFYISLSAKMPYSILPPPPHLAELTKKFTRLIWQGNYAGRWSKEEKNKKRTRFELDSSCSFFFLGWRMRGSECCRRPSIFNERRSLNPRLELLSPKEPSFFGTVSRYFSLHRKTKSICFKFPTQKVLHNFR